MEKEAYSTKITASLYQNGKLSLKNHHPVFEERYRKWFGASGANTTLNSFQKSFIIFFASLLFPVAMLYAQTESLQFRVSNSYTPKIEISKGDEVTIEAGGQIVLGVFAGSTGPGGITGFTSYNIDPSHNHGALLFKIGQGRYHVMARPKLNFVSQETGRISFAVNDRDVGNNSGSFSVKLTVKRSDGKTGGAITSASDDKRKKGFVYKSDAYWGNLQNDAILRSIFEGRFDHLYKDRTFENYFIRFIENYSHYCKDYISKAKKIEWEQVEVSNDYGIRSERPTGVAGVLYVDEKVFDVYYSYYNKIGYNNLTDIIGILGSGGRNEFGERKDIMGELFEHSVNKDLAVPMIIDKFFKTEKCDCATMTQMKENFYRFSLNQNSLQKDNRTIPGAEEESSR